ncbi:Long-chain-fatty-acid--CoA ligase 5 [Gaertneriomyces sp. JEL0708]|nr:Long-chain-fatty-acid--CoA ligase 5 [Gaertneriomyces sp. JEL0708]
MPHHHVKLGELGVPQYDADDLKRFKKQSIELEGTRTETETGIFRSALSPDELVKDYPNIKTVYDLLEHGIKVNPNGNCLGHRRVTGRDPKTGALQWSGYIWETYKQVGARRINFGAGLMNIYTEVCGGSPDDKFNLGIYSVNRPEWLISDWGASAYSNANVALYDTLGPETTEFILNHADVPICVTTLDKVAGLLKMSEQLPTVKALIVMEPLAPLPAGVPSAMDALKQWAEEKGVALYEFKEVEELGKAKPVPLRLPTPEDTWCLCYTSGTTGNPKGGILTHQNGVAVQRSTEMIIPAFKDDVHCSYLPLAHVFEKVVVNHYIVKGSALGFFRGDVTLLMDDFSTLRPTSFPSVPRLLNRIYDKVNQGATEGGAVKAALFRMALASKMEGLKSGKMTHPVWDRLVFAKVNAVTGGRMRFILSGSAPLSKDVMSFLRAAFGFQISEGYGQTESTAGCGITWPGDFSLGNVGPTIACQEVKLVSVPEMGYHSKDNKGELWIRGHNVFKGYYKDEEKTRDTITEDGWLKTGDIASIDDKGRIYIIDRKKNIFKLAQGEYIAPEKIENSYVKSGFVAQIYVHGDSLQSELVGIVVPDPEYSTQWAKQHGLLPASTPAGVPLSPAQPPQPHMVELCKDPRFRKAVKADLDAIGKADKLRGFEYVKAIHLESAVWSVENGLMTPTFKLKRNEAADKYRPVLDALYEELAAAKAADPPKAKL